MRILLIKTVRLHAFSSERLCGKIGTHIKTLTIQKFFTTQEHSFWQTAEPQFW
jgi:hypothetical protein